MARRIQVFIRTTQTTVPVPNDCSAVRQIQETCTIYIHLTWTLLCADCLICALQSLNTHSHILYVIFNGTKIKWNNIKIRYSLHRVMVRRSDMCESGALSATADAKKKRRQPELRRSRMKSKRNHNESG